MGSARRGSNPLLCIILFSFIFRAYNNWEYKQLSLLAFVFFDYFSPNAPHSLDHHSSINSGDLGIRPSMLHPIVERVGSIGC